MAGGRRMWIVFWCRLSSGWAEAYGYIENCKETVDAGRKCRQKIRAAVSDTGCTRARLCCAQPGTKQPANLICLRQSTWLYFFHPILAASAHFPPAPQTMPVQPPSPLLAPATTILNTLFTSLPAAARTSILHRIINTPSMLPLETRVRRAALSEARPARAVQQALEQLGLSRRGKNVRKRGTVRREVVRITMGGKVWRSWGPVEKGQWEVGEWVAEMEEAAEEEEEQDADYEFIHAHEVEGAV